MNTVQETLDTAQEMQVLSMKKFVIREAETLKTTRASTYGACCCARC
jgi:hypothetical protein